jgi:hypothetical protein
MFWPPLKVDMPETRCPVHGSWLETAVVPIRVGEPAYALRLNPSDKIEDPVWECDNWPGGWPFVNVRWISQDHVVGWKKTARVKFCVDCRNAWRENHLEIETKAGGPTTACSRF